MRQHKKNLNENAFSILTLDDDPIMTSTVQAYFQRSGYRVDTENDPYAAIERIRNGHYDILLLDFLMSPICGDQVVEQIRQFNKELFIILLTGHKSMAPPIKTIRALDIQGYYEKATASTSWSCWWNPASSPFARCAPSAATRMAFPPSWIPSPRSITSLPWSASPTASFILPHPSFPV